jgi:hypothetical protein
MPAPNFTRLFADIQLLHEEGNVAGAAAMFKEQLPYVLWAMQSIDFSVAAAKTELVRRGVLTSAHQRQPAISLDPISQDQLARWIDEVVNAAVTPTGPSPGHSELVEESSLSRSDVGELDSSTSSE